MTLDKIVKKLSPAVIEEMDKLSPADLEKVVVQAEQAITEAAEALEQNPKLQAARQAVSDLSAGMREVRAYQKAKSAYALLRLKESGTSA
jgi:hypothetical protein